VSKQVLIQSIFFLSGLRILALPGRVPQPLRRQGIVPNLLLFMAVSGIIVSGARGKSMSKDARQEYKKEEIIVRYDEKIRTHSGNRRRGLPVVFVVHKKPWINVDGAQIEAIKIDSVVPVRGIGPGHRLAESVTGWVKRNRNDRFTRFF
jgi:uncharacterized Fe-S cluster protein YjdI